MASSLSLSQKKKNHHTSPCLIWPSLNLQREVFSIHIIPPPCTQSYTQLLDPFCTGPWYSTMGKHHLNHMVWGHSIGSITRLFWSIKFIVWSLPVNFYKFILHWLAKIWENRVCVHLDTQNKYVMHVWTKDSLLCRIFPSKPSNGEEGHSN